uniref:Uncharacterized protein n=1 Tax=Tanacetum cinerariifolium TaxID=118510 RepID=A0A6L2NA00_TANCI|nr:hypothetical protein [Tanacetum cinerariifolium]
MYDVTKINDPQCKLLLLRAYAGVSKLYLAMRTCSPRVFARAHGSFDVNLCSSLERTVTISGPRFVDWQWWLATLPFSFGGLGVYSTGDVLNYVFLTSRLQTTSLQTRLFQHYDIATFGPTFNNALNAFNVKIETNILSNPSEIVAPKLMKKLADIYFTRGGPNLWVGVDYNDRTYRCVLCYRLGVPLFSVPKSCPACSRVFVSDIYGDHVVSCVGIVGIKDLHNIVHDTLVDICFWSGILAGKEVDIGLGGGRDKPLRPDDMLLYAWDRGLDVCVDLTGSSPLTQTGMIDFAPGRMVIEAAQRKRVKYEAKCADIGYGFLPFSFSCFGELDRNIVTLLKRIRRFSVTQEIGPRVVVHIFNRIGFAIAGGVALWQSQMENHTSDWLRVVLIFGLGQTMNACSKVFTGDIYGDHVVSCASIIGIKHRHNVMRDTLVNICFRPEISAGKEVDIGLDGGCDKPQRPGDMLLYSWDERLDHIVNGSSTRLSVHTSDMVFFPFYFLRLGIREGCGDPNEADPKVLCVTFEDLKNKHSFKPAHSLPHILIHHHHLIASPVVVLNMIGNFTRGTSYGRDGFRAQHLMNSLSGADVAIFNINHKRMMT